MAPKLSTLVRSKPDLNTTLITVVEASAFGGLIIATDYVDEQMGLDQDTLKSVSNAVPIALSLISTVGVAMTKNQAQSGFRDVQLMSTPFAIISITRVLRARGVFGRFFKKKADVTDHSKKYKHKSGETPAMHASEMSFTGQDAM